MTASHKRHLVWVGSIIFVASLIVTNCKLRRNTLRSSKAGGEALEFIVPGTLDYHRSPGNPKIGLLRFETKIEVFYEVQYWVKGNNDNNPLSFPCPLKQEAEPCSALKPGYKFNLEIPLESGKLYSFRLLLWPVNIGKGAAKALRFDEGDGLSKDAVVNDLVVTRTILPLQVTELYHHKLNKPVKVSEVQRQFQQEEGCEENRAGFANPFSEAEDTLDIKSVSSEGFASGVGTPDPKYPNRMKMVHENIERRSLWDWSFKWGDKSFEFTSRPAAYLNSIRMFGTQEVRLSNRELILPSKTIPIPNSGTIKFAWDPVNLTTTSYLVVTLTGMTTNHVVRCVFPADGEQDTLPAGQAPEGTIDPEIYRKMPADDYELVIHLESTQIQVRDDSSFPAWVMTAHDWRYDKVQKQ